MATIMQFDPNKPAKTKQFFWATYIPDRRPNFKMHANRGHALNAFQYRSNAILYKWDEKKEEWVEVYRVENWKDNDHPDCEHCGKRTLDNLMRNGGRYWDYNRGSRIWIGKKTDSPKQIWVCRDCERMLR